MTLSTSLRTAARKLIDTFGNTAILYTYSTSITTVNNEGDVVVTNWENTTATPPIAGTEILVVDGGNHGSEQLHTMIGHEQIGEDEKIIRDDIDVSLNDRLRYDSKDYRIMSIRSERVESTDIIQIIRVAEVTNTSSW